MIERKSKLSAVAAAASGAGGPARVGPAGHTPPLVRLRTEIDRAQCAAVSGFDWGVWPPRPPRCSPLWVSFCTAASRHGARGLGWRDRPVRQVAGQLAEPGQPTSPEVVVTKLRPAAVALGRPVGRAFVRGRRTTEKPVPRVGSSCQTQFREGDVSFVRPV
jgi:hypothetical protein